MKKSILFSVLVVGATLIQAQSITVHQTCGQNGQVVEVQAVDLGLSVKWANMNVGAESPEDYGNYYAWGETSTKETYNWDTYFDTNDGGNTFRKYNYSGGKRVLAPEDDAAHVNWGGSWRMPTEAECQELLDNCTWTWTTQNGINGYKVTSNKASYTDKFIFLPAAGGRADGDLGSVGSSGSYGSSSLRDYGSCTAWGLGIGSDSHYLGFSSRCFGRSVRPVLPQTSISYSSSTNDTIRIYSNGCDDYQTFIGPHGGQLTMTANSDQWSHFVRWNDGNTDNPRTITTNGNADYTAYFEAAPCLLASSICGAQGDNLTWKLSCDSVLTISGTGDMGDDAPWLSDYKEQINAVIIADGVTSITGNAFMDCTNLTSVTIPNSVTSIGNWAFNGCSGLTSVTIPNSVTSIGGGAFRGCSGLTSVTIPNSVTSIGYAAFYECSGLTAIDVATDNLNYCSEDGVLFDKDKSTLIKYPEAKQGSSYTIPNSVTSIGRSAFENCSSLTSVTIPNSVTIIGDQAFRECTGLTSVTIPNSVTIIGEYAFMNCRSLTSVTIPNSVTSIGQWAFYNCIGLTSVTIPNSVTSIGSSTFSGCTGLISVTIPNSVTSIGSGAFSGCTGLTSVTIGNSVTIIVYAAFYGCTNLTSITSEAVIPTTLGDNVFQNVDKSIPLYVPAESIDAYKAADGWKDFTNILPIGGIDIDHPTNPGTYQLTLNASIADAGVLTGAGMYAQGTEVSVSATANTGYTFEQWSDGVTDASRTITMIARDSTLTAIFSINRYTITFVDEDGTTVLSSDEYDYGATPVAPADPTKAATAQYTYTFNGWSPAIDTVTEAATYTATYSQTVNKYTITFVDEDGTTVLSSDEYDYGATPVAPADPTKAATEDNYFVFNGWDKPLTTVTAAATYTATYNSFLNNVTISGNQDLAELAVGENTHVTIGANDTLTISSPVTIATLTIYTNGNNASQINGIENLTLTNAEMIIRLEPVANTATANKWYAFGVPFEVEVTGGIYAQGSESPAVYNSAFILDEYDGALRASSQDGWKRVASSATLRPGVLYMIAISGTTNEWRMLKRTEAAFTESASLSVNAYPSTIGAHHAGWNGLANTLLHTATASLTDVEYITTYNNALSVYEVSPIAEVSLATAQPFFVQTPQAGTINFAKLRANSPARYLQQAAAQTASYTLSLSSDTYTDRAYLTTAADKEDVYCIGRDLVKMQPTTPSVPQIWIVRYDTNLAAYEIPFANDEASVTLGLYAPQAGEYRFGLENISDEYVFTLLYQGVPVTELGDQPTTLSLEQGEHTYALRIAKKPEYITALPDDVQGDDVQYTKFLRNGQIFILRDGKIYTLTGQEVK